jgi:predicted DNA-binding transcriptional regulator YafY
MDVGLMDSRRQVHDAKNAGPANSSFQFLSFSSRRRTFITAGVLLASMSTVRGRRPKAYSQVERIERLVRILASRSVTIRDLAHQLLVSPRQVRRDLHRIEEEGHPLSYSEDGGERNWQLPLGYRGVPPIAISPYELMALYLAKSQLQYLDGTPFVEDLDRVIAKVEASLPQKTHNHLERILHTFVPGPVPRRRYHLQRDILDTVRKALLLQRSLVIDYQKPHANRAKSYTVDPYALYLYQSGLYIMALSHETRALRTFAVERILRAVLAEERFVITTEHSLPQDDHRFGLIDEPAQQVRIRFTKRVAHLFKERAWHPSQTVIPHPDGGIVVMMQIGGCDEIASWVLSWGEDAKVLAPPDLVRHVTAALNAAHTQYRSPHPGGMSCRN